MLVLRISYCSFGGDKKAILTAGDQYVSSVSEACGDSHVAGLPTCPGRMTDWRLTYTEWLRSISELNWVLQAALGQTNWYNKLSIKVLECFNHTFLFLWYPSQAQTLRSYQMPKVFLVLNLILYRMRSNRIEPRQLKKNKISQITDTVKMQRHCRNVVRKVGR
jgi:hypothetical protein